ncbi:MAG: PIN domain-containing protein [Defluviitaleaceae bacterium]|nr:PIN domain-containing protein [Defluviitaleaceae bacterium]
MLLIDANAILRYLLCDNAGMAEKIEDLLENAVVTVRYEVLAEVIYVLNKVYKLQRVEIHEVIVKFLDLDSVNIEDNAVAVLALETFSQTRLDFVDTLLYAFHVINGAEVFTFDKKLLNKISQ